MKLSSILLPLSLLLAAASCTVDEPSMPEGDASQLQLSATTSYGLTLSKWEYDDLDRLTEISFGDIVYSISYVGNTNRPDSIITTIYDYIEVNDKMIRVVDEVDRWSDIGVTAAGYIAGYRSVDVDYDIHVGWDYEADREIIESITPYTETSLVTLSYDAAGHLVEELESGYDNNGNMTSTLTTFDWQNGLLVYICDSDDDHRESKKFEYSDVDNVQFQWDPNNQAFGPLATAGFFGKAPSKFLSKVSTYYNEQLDEESYYAYTLLPNGLIRMAKMTEEDETIVMTFVYRKK